MRLISWNVNGVRAAHRKGLLEWMQQDPFDILCIQETKAQPGQIQEELIDHNASFSHFVSAEKKGYSGVGAWAKNAPNQVHHGLGIEEFDREGRTQILEYDNFALFNIYYPNGKASDERLDYKMRFYDAFLAVAEKWRQKQPNLIICGDVNTAHKPIDLARPKENETVSGFLPEERAWIDTFLSHGYIDTLRAFHDEGDLYSWWSYRAGARARNVGWRIDYFFVTENLKDALKDAFILPEVMGSDHCPIGIEIEI